jgi:hypothetical protein
MSRKLVELTSEQYARCIRDRLCFCGSMLPKYPAEDARGIFLCYVCIACREEALSGYRPDVLTDGTYWHDEPIDGD